MLRAHRGDIALAPVQAHVRSPAQHAGCRAWGIDQDAVEQLALPPARGHAGVADHDLRVQPQPHQVLPDAFGARGFELQRGEFDVGAFQQVAGLAAGGCAGVQHALAGSQVGEVGGHLGGTVLHREVSVLETGQAGDVGTVRQHHGIGQPRMGGGRMAGRLQLADQRFALTAPAVDSKHQRRLAVVGRHHGGSLFWPVSLQRLGQPGGMGVACGGVGVESRQACGALALPAPQHGVDQSGQLRPLQCAHRLDGGGDGRVILQFEDFQLHQPQHQQCVHCRVLVAQRFLQQPVDRRVEAQPPACAFTEQGHQQGAVAGVGQPRGGALHHLAQRGAAQGDLGQTPGGEGAGIGFHGRRRRSGRALR